MYRTHLQFRRILLNRPFVLLRHCLVLLQQSLAQLGGQQQVLLLLLQLQPQILIRNNHISGRGGRPLGGRRFRWSGFHFENVIL